MNTRAMLPRFFTFAVPLAGVMALVTIGRVAWVLQDIRDAEKPQHISVPGPEKETEQDSGIPEPDGPKHTEDAEIEGIPSIIKKTSVAYASVSDFSAFSRDIDSVPLMKIWNSPGVQKGLEPVSVLVKEAWDKFQSKYRFSLHRIFKGLEPHAGETECVISDLSFFRGTYTVRLAVCCSIKGDTNAFIARFKDNASGLMEQKTVNGINVFQKKGRYGTFSVFFKEGRMFAAAGKDMCRNLINLLRNRNRIAGDRLADNKDFKACYSRLRRDKGLFVYIADTGFPGKQILKGPFAVSCSVKAGKVHERIMLPSVNVKKYADDSRGIRTGIRDTENIIARVHGRLTGESVEELAALSFRMVGSGSKIKLGRQKQGTFWDHMYQICMRAKAPASGVLKWDLSSHLPSWYFVADLRKNPGLRERLESLQKKYKTTKIRRSDGLDINIVQLGEERLFGSFCYFTEGDTAVYSYSSQLLKKVPVPVFAKGSGTVDADFQCTVDAGETADFIISKSLQKFFTMLKWVRLEHISRLDKVGGLIGTLQCRGTHGPVYSVLEAESNTGVTGIIPLTVYLRNVCNLREE